MLSLAVVGSPASQHERSVRESAPLRPQKLILAGLGPHGRSTYFPLIEKCSREYGLTVPLVIEIEDQRQVVEAYLSDRDYTPERLIFLDPSQRSATTLAPSLRTTLDALVDSAQADGIVIATEAKAHKAYAEWALTRGLDILMDKPITSPQNSSTDPEAARDILRDYDDLLRLHENSRSNFVIQCQRRSHEGFLFVYSQIRDVLEEYGVPISYIDIYHADGAWYTTSEFCEREGHPYQYGYGKWMHSGYHFINLFEWFASLNDSLERHRADRLEFAVQATRPADAIHQLPTSNAARLNEPLPGVAREAEIARRMTGFGETDAFLFGQLKKEHLVTTSFSVRILSTSFSRRSWDRLPADTFRSNGMVKHESVTVQLSHLMNVQIHHYQSYDRTEIEPLHTGIGHYDHFDVLLFRNRGLIGGESFEQVRFGPLVEGAHAPTLQDKAREALFLDFLDRRASVSDFSTHRRTNAILAAVYESLAEAGADQAVGTGSLGWPIKSGSAADGSDVR